jgi:hypothetical protein
MAWNPGGHFSSDFQRMAIGYVMSIPASLGSIALGKSKD